MKSKIDFAYIINLKTPISELKNRFAKVNWKQKLKYYIMPAIDGWKAKPDYWKPASWWKIDSDNSWWNRDPTPGECGCALSHLKAIKSAYEANFEQVLILEEDFVPSGNFPDPNMFLEVPNDCSILFLDRNALWKDKEQKVGTYTTEALYSYNAHAYIVTRKGMEEILSSDIYQNIITIDEAYPAFNGTSDRQDAVDLLQIKGFKQYAFDYAYFTQSSDKLTSTTENNPHDNKKLPSTFPTLPKLKDKKTGSKKIAFHSNQLGIRGTEVALYQYAKYNEEILGNKSVIMTFPNRDMEAYQKFADRFEVVIMEFSEYENYLKQNNFDCLYITKMGINDGHFLESIKTIVHSVFRYNEPHGHEYMFISDWLAKDQGYSPSTNSLPYICEPLPIVEDNLRNSLNIPSDAKVFGAYAGKEQFDIDFVKEVIKDTVRKDPKTFFIFMNILEFDDHPNIKFLPSSYDLVKKSEFVNTCDYMIHARNQGETFGLAISEFSLAGKPIITYGESEERAHIEMLGDYGIIYNNPGELRDIFENTQKYLKHEDYSIPYLNFSPENIMEKFNNLIDSKTLQTENNPNNMKLPTSSLPTVPKLKKINTKGKKEWSILDTQDWDAWCKKYIHPLVLNKEYDLAIDEPAVHVYTFPLFTKEFCDEIIELSETKKWVNDRHEFYPTTDNLLSVLGMDGIYNRLINEHIRPLAINRFQLEGRTWDNMTDESFIIRYKPEEQAHLSIHHDHSSFTTLVNLNSGEFKGGGTYFPKYKCLVNPKEIGMCTLHPGNITHKHGARPVTEGTRYVVVSFIKNSDLQ